MKTIEETILEHDLPLTVNSVMAFEDQIREFLLWYWRVIQNPDFLMDDKDKLDYQVNLIIRKYRTRILRHEE